MSFAKVAAAIHAGGEDEEEEEQLQRKTARPPEHLEESPQAGRRKACRKKLSYSMGNNHYRHFYAWPVSGVWAIYRLHLNHSSLI